MAGVALSTVGAGETAGEGVKLVDSGADTVAVCEGGEEIREGDEFNGGTGGTVRQGDGRGFVLEPLVLSPLKEVGGLVNKFSVEGLAAPTKTFHSILFVALNKRDEEVSRE